MNNYSSKNLRYLRKLHHLTQDKLASILNIDRTTLSSWEGKTRNINTDSLITISDHFNISLDELVKKDLAENITEENCSQECPIIISTDFSDIIEEFNKNFVDMISNLKDFSDELDILSDLFAEAMDKEDYEEAESLGRCMLVRGDYGSFYMLADVLQKQRLSLKEIICDEFGEAAFQSTETAEDRKSQYRKLSEYANAAYEILKTMEAADEF